MTEENALSERTVRQIKRHAPSYRQRNAGPALFAGAGLGKALGLSLGSAPTLSERAKQVGRWVAAIVPLAAEARLAPNVVYIQDDAGSIITGGIYAVALAAPCLLVGWLLRSWWGFALAPAVVLSAFGNAIEMYRARRR